MATRTTKELLVDGTPRGLVLHTPPESGTGPPFPAMLILHGSTEAAGDDADDLNYPALRFERHYDEDIFAPMRHEHGLVVAYLSARRSNGWYCWENGNGEVGLCALPSTGSDEAFVRAALLLMHTSVAGGIDDSRIFVFGMSGGASMAWKLGCHAPSVTAINASVHVAAVAGTLAPSLRACCCAAPSVVAVHGDADGYVDVQTADTTASWFGVAHGCDGNGVDTDDVRAAADDVELRVYSGCRQSRLEYYRVAGGGHTLPGAPVIWAGLGSTSAFDAAGAIWRSWHGGTARAVAEDSEDGGECGAGGACQLSDYAAVIAACAVLMLCAATACGVLGWESRRRRGVGSQPGTWSGSATTTTTTTTTMTAQGVETVFKSATTNPADGGAVPARECSPELSVSSERGPPAGASPPLRGADQAKERARPLSQRPIPTGGGGLTLALELELEPRAVAQLWLSDAVLCASRSSSPGSSEEIALAGASDRSSHA